MLQIQDRLRDQLDLVDWICDGINSNSWTTSSWTLDSLEYLKLRLQYKIWIFWELSEIAQNMTNSQTVSMNIFVRNFENKYSNEDDEEKMAQFERLLWSATKIQEMSWELNFSEADKKKIMNSVKYIELKMYEKIEDLENS